MTTSKIVAEVVWLSLMLSAGFVGAIRTLPLWVLGDSTELWIASGVSFLLIDRAVVSGEKLANRLIGASGKRPSDDIIIDARGTDPNLLRSSLADRMGEATKPYEDV